MSIAKMLLPVALSYSSSILPMNLHFNQLSLQLLFYTFLLNMPPQTFFSHLLQ
ncbi:hypothetical protein OIU79_018988 [Salix purpurea]|uniref:Uncharacterized protein n=1 Tax=Salix purpurea TaxID=77065 RepID=A0A9Q0P037_SALPP|nr:hypothetical protein OIU79_018988 [Salix purpurea]